MEVVRGGNVFAKHLSKTKLSVLKTFLHFFMFEMYCAVFFNNFSTNDTLEVKDQLQYKADIYKFDNSSLKVSQALHFF